MTTTLIVLAHPDGRSFNGQWAQATADAATALGDTVLTSDLCAMGFDAVESARHYTDWPKSEPFDPLKAQERAAEAGTLDPVVQSEMAKLRKADRVILHFPLWWFAPPAILKGWCERTFVHGALQSVDARFDTGPMRSRSVMFCVTTGSVAAESAPDGKEGDVQMLLWPLAYTMRYLGYDVVAPRLVHGVHGYHKGAARDALGARLNRVLRDQAEVMAGFDTLPRLAFNADEDFDETGRLRPDRSSHSRFIRHVES